MKKKIISLTLILSFSFSLTASNICYASEKKVVPIKINNNLINSGVKKIEKRINNVNQTIEIGNTNGNIANAGKVVQNGEWIYYSGADSNGLYKIKTDNTCKTKLFDGSVHYINVSKDWIYFIYSDEYNSNINGFKPCIYKIKTDGSSKIKLYENDDISNLIVINDCLYFSAYSQDANYELHGGVYKMKTDGTSKTLLPKEYSINNIINDWSYCFDDKGIYKTKIDGSNKIRLSNIVPSFMIARDKYIYYQIQTEPYSEYKIYKMDLDGKNIKEICKYTSYMTELFNSNFFNVDDEWVYYVSLNDSNLNLYKIRTDGTECTKLIDEGCQYINLTKDWVYCEGMSYAKGNYNGPAFEIKEYRIKKDGAEKQIIESCIIED
ncbi:DUF5050 domain-containing protein [Clostridium sp. ZS2-4]|uniref:DUF5050 domain-containing protein n=1 Tax=Clostridium sp. ZS2-4 TaxID=2987703 RepID=UPI00227C6741|nr:DUF5050 domain-containing protein [Clostridium sp. ZS2-4]MCY6354879.1 DUF5050 domain-containing protein [Clostridium sp. ZS2-4]